MADDSSKRESDSGDQDGTSSVSPTKAVRPKHLTQNGSAISPLDDEDQQRSPSPRYRSLGDLTSPTSRSPSRCHSPSMMRSSRSRSRTPSPTRDLGSPEPEEMPKTKTVSFHSHTNWKNERKIHSGE